MENNDRAAGDTYSVVRIDNALVPQMAALELRCFSDPWSEKELADSVASPFYCFFAAMDGERMLGYAGVLMTPPEAQIVSICVEPSMRRRGIARALLRVLLQTAASAGAEVALLEVREHNAGAIALYESEHFSCVGTRKNYYRNPTENALLYLLELRSKEYV